MSILRTPWSILDRCTIINKGLGFFDFNELINGLLGMVGPNGQLMGYPMAMDDITGEHLTGVEADAVYEAIYNADPSDPQHLTIQEAALIQAGPQGDEDTYKAALQKAIEIGSKTINHAVEVQNHLWGQKRQEASMTGKGLDKIPDDLPLPFKTDMGRAVLDSQWREGVWGPQKKETPWQFDAYGVPKLRVGNRDQENFQNESWNRPYHEGLKWVREQSGHTGNTSKVIKPGKVRPNGIYINNEAYKHSIAMVNEMAQQAQMGGYELTPEMVQNAWLNHPVLSQHAPENKTNIQHLYGIRRREAAQSPDTPGIVADAVPEGPDAAQQAIEQQQMPQSPMDAYSTWFEDGFKSEKGVDLYANSFANKRAYLPKLHQYLGDKYNMGDNMPSIEELVAQGSGRAGADRLVSGFISHIQRTNPGIQPNQNRMQEPQQPQPQPEPQPQQPPQPTNTGQPQGPQGLREAMERQKARRAQAREPQQQPQPPAPQPEPQPPAPPVVQPQPPAPPVPRQQPAPPVPRQQPAPPATVGQIPPNIPPEQPPSRLNAFQAQPAGSQRQDGPPRFREGWRGMADKLAYLTGRGAGRMGNMFGKEDIESMLETVQCQIALQDDTIAKSVPHTPMIQSNATDLAMMAGQIQRPVSDVVAILNSRGDWREMSKSMDIPLDCIQLVKVTFNDQ
jgi:hypothetical protein